MSAEQETKPADPQAAQKSVQDKLEVAKGHKDAGNKAFAAGDLPAAYKEWHMVS